MENDYQKQIQPGIQHTGNNQEKQRPFRISYCPEHRGSVVIEHEKRHAHEVNLHI